MTNFIKNVAIIIGALFVSIAASIYTHYFIGMGISLFAQRVLGVDGLTIASNFAWIGVALPIIVLAILMAYSMIEAREARTIELDGEEIGRLMKELGKEDD